MSYSSRQTYLDHMPNSRLFCRDRLPSSRLFYRDRTPSNSRLIVIISPPSLRRRGVGGEVTQFFLENETALGFGGAVPRSGVPCSLLYQ
ncbi:hypothetical protein PCC7805_02027 [Planktothrix agardhii]|jgi:hypothetical protein|nr:hypothetical protein PCC7805_02027 [Planktothrix agardhii]